MNNDTKNFDSIIQATPADVIYQRDIAQTTLQPEFKPGNTPHTQLGDEVLNDNIAWHAIINDIMPAHYTQEKLTNESGLSAQLITAILDKNYQDLTFRLGARLLMVHSRFHPEQYA